MNKIILLSSLLFMASCSLFRSCPCEEQIKENKMLVIPKDLKE